MCSLLYPLQLNYRLDYWPGREKITQGFKMEPTSMCPRRVEVVRQSDSFETLLLQPYAVRVICALAAEKETELRRASVIVAMMLLLVVWRLDNFVVPFGGAIPKN